MITAPFSISVPQIYSFEDHMQRQEETQTIQLHVQGENLHDDLYCVLTIDSDLELESAL